MTDLDLYFRFKCEKGLEAKGLASNPEYRKRLDYEIGVIIEFGFAGYFLVVENLLNWARNHQIPTGSGRGSVGGSLAAFCLEIVHLDPIKYGLFFERFLNPGRAAVSPPDIDMDFCELRRDEVIKYVEEKYGKDCVSHIGTVGTLKAKGAIRDIARTLGLSYDLGDKLAKMTLEPIEGKPQPLTTCYEKVVELKNLRWGEPSDARTILEWAEKVEERPRHVGVHPSGVIISDRPISQIAPLYLGKDGVVATQWDMRDVEEVGLVKFDFLGLRALTTIDRCLKLIKKNYGNDIDIQNISVDDPKVYKLLQTGNVAGVFQVETSGGMKDLLIQIRPTCLEDIAILLSAYRPGPLATNALQKYLEVRSGATTPSYLIPELESVLKRTDGFCLCAGEKVTIIKDDLFVEKNIEHVSFGDKVLGADGGNYLVLNTFDNGIRETIELKTDYKNSIRCTPNHLLLTIEGLKKAEKCKHVFRSRFQNKQKEEVIKFPWLLGFSVAEGCLGASSPVLTIGEFRNIDCVEKNLSESFEGTSYHYFNTRAWYVGIKRKEGVYSNPFNEWLKKYELFGKVNNNKFTPTLVLSASEEDICKYLAGYIDGDGRVSEEMISISCGFEEGRRRLGLLLDRIKLTYYLNSHLIIFRDRTLFKEKIQPFCKIKKDIFVKDGLFGDLEISKEFFQEEVLRLKEKTSIRRFFIEKDISRTVLYGNKNSGVKIESLLRILPEKEKKDFIQKYLRGNFSLQSIVDIKENGKQHVYDIEIDSKEHLFLSNGYIVHNCIYQEQVMEICKELAGYTLIEADEMRKILGKKLEKKMPEQQEKFVKGCVSNGISERNAKIIFEDIKGFASYSFNKSHAISYSYITYQMAWLKTYYPLELICACLISDSDESDKIIQYINHCQEKGIFCLGPSVNESETGFSVTPDKKAIRFGLSAVKNLGKPVSEIIRERENRGPFTSILDFCNRMDLSKFNKKKLESLVLAGAFDSIGGWSRASLLGAIDNVLEYKEENKRYESKNETFLKRMAAFEIRQSEIALYDTDPISFKKRPPMLKLPEEPIKPALPSIPKIEELPTMELLRQEKELLGYYLSGHPLDEVIEKSKITISMIKENAGTKQRVSFIAIPSSIEEITTKKKKQKMAYLVLEDKTGTIQGIIFPKQFSQYSNLIDLTTPAKYEGEVEITETDVGKSVKLMILSITELPSMKVMDQKPVNAVLDLSKAEDIIKELVPGGTIPVNLKIKSSEQSYYWDFGDFNCQGNRLELLRKLSN